ncbi:MAG: hypothetical protein KF841_13010 [Phycisphaerae bacterium]|nr:hypothetical protein [Phycisphaerae bacterium]
MPSFLAENVAGSALPSALADLIERVVRGTRLWRSEKRDVRAELESHFREGLEELASEGHSEDAAVQILCDRFGNPDLTAKLIRRGKKRGRPMILKIAVAASIASLSAVGAGATYMAVITWGKPSPSIDYLKQLNEPVEKVAVDQRAWTVLADALIAFKPMPNDLAALDPASMQPGGADWAAVQRWIESNRPLLASFREAAGRPFYGFVYGGSDTAEFLQKLSESRALSEGSVDAASESDPLQPPLISILLPHLSEMRKVAWFLVLDSRDHALQGRLAEAWDSLDVSFRMGLQLFEGRTLIEQLVGASVIRLSCEEIRRFAGDQSEGMSPELSARIASSGVLKCRSDGISPHYDGELLSFQDVVQYVFTDDGNGNGRIIPSQIKRIRSILQDETAGEPRTGMERDAEILAMASRHADRRDTLLKYEELWHDMAGFRALPLYDSRRSDGDRLLNRFLNSEEVERFELIRLLMPSLSYADQVIRESAMEVAATRATLWVVIRHNETGTWPKSWGELSDLPGGEPEDAYAPASLRYSIGEDGRPVIYSVWRNGVDDGGSSVSVGDASRRIASQTPADLIYFPMAHR